jgi:hypothetical protein
MNRISRHFADGGLVSALIGNLMGGAEKSIGGGLGFLGKTTMEASGISPTARLLQGKKQTNWDYLGAAAMFAGPAKAMGLLPKILGSLAVLTEGGDLTQNAFETASNLRGSTTASGGQHVYNVNVNVAKVDSTVDMERAISNAMAKVEAKAKMSGLTSRVGA